MAGGRVFSRFAGWWRSLNLWARLAIAVTAGFLVLFGVFSFLALRAVNDSTDRILRERLVISQMSALELDRLLERAFYELEKATTFAAFDPQATSLSEEVHMLAHAYGRVGTLSLGVYFLDAQGKVVLSEPPGRLERGTDLSGESHILEALQTRGRSVSAPFTEPATGKPAVALTIPILNADGTLRAVLSGLVDLSSAEVLGSLLHAKDLGHTGHAELVDDRGLIVASTDYGGFLQPGEHLDFYLRMLRTGGSRVENTPYTPWHPVTGKQKDERHVMAFASLSTAPWGVAVGGLDRETFAPVVRLRNTLLIGGGLSLVFVWALALVGARALVRPVRTLTGAAQAMAAGDLERPVGVSQGGEIGVLGESLEAMRQQLKESLERVRRWGEELEVKVRERTAELAGLLGELRRLEAQREVERMKAEFISAVSHELRTPLGVIRGYATTLLRQDITIDPATLREFLQIIEEEAGRLQRMIDELLDASRLQAGRLPVEKRPVSLVGLVQGAVSKVRASLEKTGHILEVRVPGEDFHVLADPLRVEQVLHNLLDNACLYSEPNTAVKVTATQEGDHAVVGVADQGDGIPEAERGRVFEPFYRGENTRRRSVRGTGLGLAICRGIVEAHGGTIWVESLPRQGSTFFFTLPLAETSPITLSTQDAATPAGQEARR